MRFCFSFILTIAFSLNALANDGNYSRQEIASNRYGGQHSQLLQKAYDLPNLVKPMVIGQDSAVEAVSNAFARYMEEFGTRKKEPVVVVLGGPTGVGKSKLIYALEQVGIPIGSLDLQAYGESGRSFSVELARIISKTDAGKKPFIVALEEIDKFPEIQSKSQPTGRGDDAQGRLEKTVEHIGAINEMFSEGRLKVANSTEDENVSNIMFIVTMNYPPDLIEEFSRDFLKKKKDYYEFTLSDLQALDKWVRETPSSRWRVLSRLFRPNTVGRLAPNTFFLNSISEESYVEITDGVIQSTIKRFEQSNKDRRIQATYEQPFVEFLSALTQFAASGARETDLGVDRLMSQLIVYGEKTQPPEHPSTIERPRKIHFSVGKESKTPVVNVKVTPQIYKSGKLVDGEPFEFKVSYDLNQRGFKRPDNFVFTPPVIRTRAESDEEKPSRITKRMIRETRFPEEQKRVKGLAAFLNTHIFGQEKAAQILEEDLRRYFGRGANKKGHPLARIFASLTGVGKSELIIKTAEYLKIPLLTINMQAFTGEEDDGKLLSYIASWKVDNLSEENQKYIVVFEEIDKARELDSEGELLQRPALAVVKDFFNKGTHGSEEYNYENDDAPSVSIADLRDAYIAGTMNFSTEDFGFRADPRITSLEDVEEWFKDLDKRPADLQEILSSMFLVDTVGRLFPRITLVPPIREGDYQKIIQRDSTAVAQNRFHDEDGRNVTALTLELSPSYFKMLLNETVIPALGARQTSVRTSDLVGLHIESAVASLPSKGDWADSPLVIKLDYDPVGRNVSGHATLRKGKKEETRQLFIEPIKLQFPPPEITGEIPANRLHTGVHEFGHAFMGVLMGLRFVNVVTFGIEKNYAGFVQFRHNDQWAKQHISEIFMSLASRALERIVFSHQPKDPWSLLEISSGASVDIENATTGLYRLLYDVSLNPHGGVLSLGQKSHRRIDFAAIPHETAQKLGRVLKELEQFMVEDLLRLHSKEWYIEKSEVAARVGELKEDGFYRLIGYNYPGKNKRSVFYNKNLQDAFAASVQKPNEEMIIARGPQPNHLETTVFDNVDRYTNAFMSAVQRHLHPDVKIDDVIPAVAAVLDTQTACTSLFH